MLRWCYIERIRYWRSQTTRPTCYGWIKSLLRCALKAYCIGLVSNLLAIVWCILYGLFSFVGFFLRTSSFRFFFNVLLSFCFLLFCWLFASRRIKNLGVLRYKNLNHWEELSAFTPHHLIKKQDTLIDRTKHPDGLWSNAHRIIVDTINRREHGASGCRPDERAPNAGHRTPGNGSWVIKNHAKTPLTPHNAINRPRVKDVLV